MIIDLPRFVATERPYWTELETVLNRIENEPNARLTIDEVKRFHFLYERAAADLARITTFSTEPETRQFLENLVSRAYGEIHETRDRKFNLQIGTWFIRTLPRTFRQHIRAFVLSVLITLAGSIFGAFAVAFDPDAKAIITPFPHLLGDPSKRVDEEEAETAPLVRQHHASFSAELMVNNTRVSIMAMALGITYGVGTTIILFYNGTILGAVALDYIRAGESVFLAGWLLPHGAVEIPAILIGGQAGLILAGALIGWGVRRPLRERMRAVGPDLLTLCAGLALLLIWAGLVESFLSQYHEPIFPYWLKITFGLVELTLLAFYLARSGSSNK